MINEDALRYLKKCYYRIEEVPQDIRNRAWMGESATDWFKSVNVDWKPYALSETPLNRYQLLDRIESITSKTPIQSSVLRACIIEIFAWGGKRFYKQETLSSLGSFEGICKQLLKNRISAVDAYDGFYTASSNGTMKGLGPAYYTKLICFLGDQSGLVMDQWTARSVNKLFNSNIVQMDTKTVVSKRNSSEVYSNFLQCVKHIQNELSIDSLLKAEELIFSCSHKKNILGKEVSKDNHTILSAWRRYVESGEEVLS